MKHNHQNNTTDITTQLRARAKSWADNSTDAQLDTEAANKIEQLQTSLHIAATELTVVHQRYTECDPETIHKSLLEDGKKEWETNHE